MIDAETYLKEHGVKPTAVRLLVWRDIAGRKETFSLGDVECSMPSMDRSSIFRALRLFAEHHLLHEIDDGTGQKKYCICRCSDSHHASHLHFTCLCCGQTYCLEDCQIPLVELPQGFLMHEAEYIVKGICPQCRMKG